MLHRRRKVPLFVLAALLFGFKTYVVYRFVFDIELDNLLQEIIIFINPFIASIIFFGLSVWFKTEKQQKLFVQYSALIGTIIIYFNVVFYRSFTDFLTIPQLFQTSNISDLSSSILELIKLYDIFIFVDVMIIWYITKKVTNIYVPVYSRRKKIFTLVVSLLLLSGNFLLAEMERPQLLSRAFDREYLVKNIGLFYYHVYDAALQSKMRTQKVIADDNDLVEIKKYIHEEVRSDEQSSLYGIAKDKNVIFVSAESLQSFVIENTLHGEEVTPFLNRLIDDPGTFYFENFYHQTGQGKTSDSEFITENSLYPIASGAVFFTHADNNYYAMPEALKQHGYQSVVFHANTETFWNRNQMYESLGIDTFYDYDSYDVTEENSIGWGLKDKPFFEQTIPYMKELETPFYAKLITITNHFPFDLEEEDKTLANYDSNSKTLNQYFSTVRYMDEAIEQFFMHLKLNGLYEDSIIIIMGDHDGISANHNKAMAQYLNKEEITPYDLLQLQRVPFYIHIPGYEHGERMDKIAGQVDIKPTVLRLLGLDTSNDLYFGNDLFHDDRKGFITLRNGDFISDDYVFASEICYDRETGEPIDALNMYGEEESACAEVSKKVTKELQYSDAIIYGDLFRFVDFQTK
ncbi:LTA synthase family protein [Pseudogracilibacillus sp. ICA-222130]|uniref:LTA synthase family protein n=1 Tax=Pseudogracilibacillus sp. ICA-222130 TaxID=3134655 RepID=UPI0030BB6140